MVDDEDDGNLAVDVDADVDADVHPDEKDGALLQVDALHTARSPYTDDDGPVDVVHPDGKDATIPQVDPPDDVLPDVPLPELIHAPCKLLQRWTPQWGVAKTYNPHPLW